MAERFRRVVFAMEATFPDAMVSGFEVLEGTLGCADPQDEHVLAAAIKAQAAAVVTANVKDFPADAFERFGIEVLHPDALLMSQAELTPNLVLTSLAEMQSSFSRPSLKAAEIAAALRRSGCDEFARFLADRTGEINGLATRF